MEQHPVPRNISGFQFHLIGDMTLRQFVYLASGLASAYLIYKIAPFPAVIKFPLAGIFGLTGFAFAFLPIQDRPLDKWLVAFVKSITSPTQYLWVKNNPPPQILTRTLSTSSVSLQPTHISAHRQANEKLKTYLSTLQKQPHEVLNAREKRYIEETLSLFGTQAAFVRVSTTANIKTSPQTPSAPFPTPASSQPTAPAPVSNIDLAAFKKQLDQLASEKKLLEQELLRLKNEADKLKEPQVVKPSPVKEVAEPTIKAVSPQIASSEMGLTNLAQTPNLITGVLKDPQKKVLPNIILTIKDKNGMPLRALKTNKLGQFVTATPLPNGTYFLEIEDPLKRYVFDIAQIILSGKVFLPIEIIAKGEKELMREKLTKELFGSQII